MKPQQLYIWNTSGAEIDLVNPEIAFPANSIDPTLTDEAAILAVPTSVELDYTDDAIEIDALTTQSPDFREAILDGSLVLVLVDDSGSIVSDGGNPFAFALKSVTEEGQIEQLLDNKAATETVAGDLDTFETTQAAKDSTQDTATTAIANTAATAQSTADAAATEAGNNAADISGLQTSITNIENSLIPMHNVSVVHNPVLESPNTTLVEIYSSDIEFEEGEYEINLNIETEASRGKNYPVYYKLQVAGTDVKTEKKNLSSKTEDVSFIERFTVPAGTHTLKMFVWTSSQRSIVKVSKVEGKISKV